jgi:dihydroneopterin triphosphate diphosphatase
MSMQKPYKIPESVLVVIHTADLDVLLIERADRPGYWQSVTGSKDMPDEALTQTAVREVFEETGIRVGGSAPAAENGLSSVPLHNLSNWKLSNVYEIYPVWRHR